MTTFKELSELCERLKETFGRKDKVSLIVRFLRNLDPIQVEYASRLLIGKPLPENMSDELDVGYNTLIEIRDMQSTLMHEPLTINDVAEKLLEIAKIKGYGSREKKKNIILGLLARMDEVEREWFMKIVIGEMQHGVNEGVLLEALAEIGGVSLEHIHRAYMLVGDIGELAKQLKIHGGGIVESIRLEVYRPVKPMLAEQCQDIRELFKEPNVMYALEYKVDGARVQIHVGYNGVKIFSRGLKDITESIPDVIEQVEKNVKKCIAVLDGEIIAVDSSNRPLPFQVLLRRFRRTRTFEEDLQIPLRLYLFDILYLDGLELMDLPYFERWNKLKSISSPDLLIPRRIAYSEKDVKEFLESATNAGHEGIMLKKLDGKYKPGRREKLWLKIKPSETLDLVIIKADYGYGRRTGWLSNYHLAAYDPETGGFEIVGKTFK
ncbi:MAG: ATP-dependent DNA ligase, partial [Nitrososphaerota archaeon]